MKYENEKIKMEMKKQNVKMKYKNGNDSAEWN